MDPVSVALLVALAGGVGGEVGRQSWSSLSALVRRPFQRDDENSPEVSSSELELTRLEEAPGDLSRAESLRAALAARAAVDASFRQELQRWHEEAKLTFTGNGEVSNTISGGTFSGPVLQGRDFSAVSFNTPATPATPRNPQSAQD